MSNGRNGELGSFDVNLQHYLNEQLRMRYAPDSILPYDDNKITRGYFTDRSSMTNEEIAQLKLLNPNIAKMDLRFLSHIPESQNKYPDHFKNPLMRKILEELDIMPTREDLLAVKERALKVCIVGYGGAMINFLYNLHLWQSELDVNGIFDRLIVFEKDNIEFTNLMRLGKEVVYEYYPKINGASEHVTALPKLMLLREEKELVNEFKPNIFNRWLTAEYAAAMHEKDYIFVGAPSFEAREFLYDKNFYFIGHGDTEVDITKSPAVDMSLGNETYGTIDIPVLILNLQIATAAWIKHMASGAEVEPDTDIFKFDMATYLRENPEAINVLNTTEGAN